MLLESAGDERSAPRGKVQKELVHAGQDRLGQQVGEELRWLLSLRLGG